MGPQVLGLLRPCNQTGSVARAAPFSEGGRGGLRGVAWEEGEEVEHLAAVHGLGITVDVVGADDPGEAGIPLGFSSVLQPRLFRR